MAARVAEGGNPRSRRYENTAPPQDPRPQAFGDTKESEKPAQHTKEQCHVQTADGQQMRRTRAGIIPTDGIVQVSSLPQEQGGGESFPSLGQKLQAGGKSPP